MIQREIRREKRRYEVQQKQELKRREDQDEKLQLLPENSTIFTQLSQFSDHRNRQEQATGYERDRLPHYFRTPCTDTSRLPSVNSSAYHCLAPPGEADPGIAQERVEACSI